MLGVIINIFHVLRGAGFELAGEAGAQWSVLFLAGADPCEQAPFVPLQHHGQRRSARPAAALSGAGAGSSPGPRWSAASSGRPPTQSCPRVG